MEAQQCLEVQNGPAQALLPHGVCVEAIRTGDRAAGGSFVFHFTAVNLRVKAAYSGVD